MQISKYTVGIAFNIDRRSMTIVDRQMKLLEKRISTMSKRLQESFGKSFVLPELKVKKFKFDSLALQRGAQMELNKVSRLLELKIGNVKLDQAKINQQVQNVFQRAANNARVNVKTVAGTGGGGNPFHIPRPSHTSNTFMPGVGFGIPRIGLAGGIATGVVGAGIYGVSKTNEARQLTATREGQRLKLETAVGGSRERRDSFTAGLINLSNKLGINAESQVEAYSRFMKQARSSGMTANEGFDLFKNVATATRGNGGDQQSIERQAYALQQMLGVGYLRGEELNQQLADSNPAIKKFIMQAFAERTGKQGTEAFLTALSKRQVSVDDVLKGYEKSAKEASERVRELSNSIQGAEARLSNMRFGEELERTVDGPMTKAALQWTEAQSELHRATLPLRDAFYSAAAGATSFAATLLGASIKQIQASPAMNGGISPEMRDTSPMSSASGRGLLGVPDIRNLQQPQSKFISPLALEIPEWQKEAGKHTPSLSEMNKSFTSNSNNSVTVSPGAIVVNTHATNADQLASELTPHIKEIFRGQMTDALTEVMIQSPYTE